MSTTEETSPLFTREIFHGKNCKQCLGLTSILRRWRSMDRSYLWTKSRARLQLVRSSEGRNLQWLFLPGGPGLGSESLFPLLNILELPGSTWRLDLPGDGSNTTLNNKESFSHWSSALTEATKALENVYGREIPLDFRIWHPILVLGQVA